MESQIYKAINAVMQDIDCIGKTKKNMQQGFMFRGIDDVMNTMKPLLSKHGVFVYPEVINQVREERQTTRGGTLIYSILTVRHHFAATDGSEIVTTTIGEGMDSGDKASNKAMAIAYKYAMFQTFCIPTEEMAQADPDTTTPEPIKPTPALDLDINQYVAQLQACQTLDELRATYMAMPVVVKSNGTILKIKNELKTFFTKQEDLQEA